MPKKTIDENIISIQNLTKKFGEDIVLHDISVDFYKGKIYGIIGNNGSGKSVFFKCICGLLPATKGSITVENKVIGKDLDFPESMGMLIEYPGFLPNLSGFKNLNILASLRGEIKKEDICNIMKKVGLDPSLRKGVGKYSLGMRQRLGIAQAIMEDPRLLILDEPFNGLDKQAVEEFRLMIKELNNQGKTILLSSHNPADIEMLADEVFEMEAGVLIKH